MYQSVAVTLALSLAAGTGQATPVHYNELVDGELPAAALFGGTAPALIGTFDVGANSVTGALTASRLVLDFRDSFAFVIPTGLQVTSASVLANYANCGVAFQCDWLLDFTAGNFSFSSLGVFPQTSDVLLFPVSLPAGSYVGHAFSSPEFDLGLPNLPLERQIAYTVTFNVAPVPGPPGFVLLATALLAVILRGAPRLVPQVSPSG